MCVYMQGWGKKKKGGKSRKRKCWDQCEWTRKWNTNDFLMQIKRGKNSTK